MSFNTDIMFVLRRHHLLTTPSSIAKVTDQVDVTPAFGTRTFVTWHKRYTGILTTLRLTLCLQEKKAQPLILINRSLNLI